MKTSERKDQRQQIKLKGKLQGRQEILPQISRDPITFLHIQKQLPYILRLELLQLQLHD